MLLIYEKNNSLTTKHHINHYAGNEENDLRNNSEIFFLLSLPQMLKLIFKYLHKKSIMIHHIQ